MNFAFFSRKWVR